MSVINRDWKSIKILLKHVIAHLAPPDHFLFPKVKFIMNTDLITAVLNIITEDAFSKCCHSFYNHSDKCI
jgi:hypothetical protein